jgi:sulfate-transporting ATPase
MDEIELGGNYVNSRAYVSWFGFKSAQQQQRVSNLSGGERNRVQLAKLLKSGANFIILDGKCIPHNSMHQLVWYTNSGSKPNL